MYAPHALPSLCLTKLSLNTIPFTYCLSQFLYSFFGLFSSVGRPIGFPFNNANEDGINDHFKVDGIGINEFKMLVFDRWCNMIFYCEKLDHACDASFQGKSGNIVMQDVYVWKAELKDLFSKKHDYHGTVSIVK